MKGVHNLRVIDSSVYPTVINANTNATAMLAGEKGAALVWEDNHQGYTVVIIEVKSSFIFY